MHLELEVYKGVACRVFISTGIVLDNKAQWDSARQLVIKNSNAEQYNKFLRQTIQNIQEADEEAERRGDMLTPQAIKMAAKSQTAKGDDVIETFLRYASEEPTRESSRRTHHSYVTGFQKFVRQHKSSPKATLHFGEVSLNLIKEFDKYLMKNYTPAIASNIHMQIRKYMRKARKDGLVAVNPYDNFEFNVYESDPRQALTEEQFRAVEDIDRSILSEHSIHEYVLDMFLFACYTGLRCSDVMTIMKSDLSKDAKGYVLQKTTIKTGIDVTLPLYALFNGKPQVIAEKYMRSHEDYETLFPPTTKPIIIRSVRHIGELVELPFTLTFHVSRHTCASQLAERVDNPFVIMSVLGHGEIRTSMRYIHKSRKSAEKKLSNIQWEEPKTALPIVPDEEIRTPIDALREICEKKQLDATLCRYVIGFAFSHLDKIDDISVWIGKIRKTDYSLETFCKRLEMLVA